MTRRRKHKGKQAIIATSLLAACGSPAQPETRANLVEPAQRDPAAEAVAMLAHDALHHTRFARRTLYTWTTAEQIDELRRTKQLLVRDESPVSGASYLDQVLYVLAQRGEPLAKLLYTTGFAKMRFAWHAPWATRDGWPTEQYGDNLIKITLKPEAIIVSLSSATGELTAKNLLNEPVPLANVIAKPETIGAIYFVSDATSTAPGIPRSTATFRELALCNESMIESWEVGTAAIRDELARNATTLDAMVRYLRTKPTSPRAIPSAVWPAATAHPSPEVAYAAALALDSPMYRLDPDRLAALASRLRSLPKQVAFEANSTATFSGTATARKAPRIVKQTNATYASSYSQPPRSPTAAHP
jgi:hypothetical protein